MLQCSECGMEFQLVGNPEDGFYRSLCVCDESNKCADCKRPHLNPINQAKVTVKYDVIAFYCKDHGYFEAENFPVIEVKPKVKRETVVEVVNIKSRSIEYYDDVASLPESAKPSVIPDNFEDYTEVAWKKEIENVKLDIQRSAPKFKSICTKCNKTFAARDAKVKPNNEKKTIHIVCPHCEGPGSRAL